MMKAGRTFLVFLAAAAIACGPALAAFSPCCCATPIEKRQSCCARADQVSSRPAHTCCADLPRAADVQACCCAPSQMPISTAPAKPVRPAGEGVAQPAVTAPAIVAMLAPRVGGAAPVVDLDFPAHPPLRVLYCSWLN